MPGIARILTATAVTAALLAVPTGAIASAPPAVSAAPAAQQQAAAGSAATTTANPWLALSAMTTTSGAASAAAYQDDGGPGFPPIIPLAIILATVALAIWILVSDDDEDLDIIDVPVSP